ncbi:ArsR/SmtB family transcription factor [Thermospira aquatica]|uniref:Metalloregulator ArsR/SmtB family transcription factor n=1 Tax=Thermospira aquatica TaxID=2828656 RepID=A0AAX3BFH9_9SPIR|nr:metalloregulator ArsR/SmtB family transcription factor [Thermospira aquatica]URA11042.1 metalloregulator ArsR/SmtB family transcription factor [Thermospira aquatica]
MVEKFRVLGDETRLRIVKLLQQTPWLYVCDIVAVLEQPFYAISRHLKELRHIGLVMEQKEGRFIRYSLGKSVSPSDEKLYELITTIENDQTLRDRDRLRKRLEIRLKNPEISCELVEE